MITRSMYGSMESSSAFALAIFSPFSYSKLRGYYIDIRFFKVVVYFWLELKVVLSNSDTYS